MSRILHIDSDPTGWILSVPADPARVAAADEVQALAVSEPLAGTLLLSPRAAGSLVFQDPPPGQGWVPSGAFLLRGPTLYLPSASGPAHGSAGYLLPRAADLGKLAGQITAAMTGRTRLVVEVAGLPGPATAVLNGATLAFAVLCPATGPA